MTPRHQRPYHMVQVRIVRNTERFIRTVVVLSIQIKVYPVSNMRQDVYRFMADEFEFTPVPESSEAGRFFSEDRQPAERGEGRYNSGELSILHSIFRVAEFRLGDIETMAGIFLSPIRKLRCLVSVNSTMQNLPARKSFITPDGGRLMLISLLQLKQRPASKIPVPE